MIPRRAGQRRAAWWIAASLAVLGAGALLIADNAAWLERTDIAGLAFANAVRRGPLDTFFGAITWLGSLYVLAPASMLFACTLARVRRPLATTLLVPLALSGAALLAHSGKWLADRPRPALHDSLIPLPADPAYPSGHAMQAVAFGVAVLFAARPQSALARSVFGTCVASIVTAVLASRVYLQVHFPSDVVFGALAAYCWVLALQAALTNEHRPALDRTPVPQRPASGVGRHPH